MIKGRDPQNPQNEPPPQTPWRLSLDFAGLVLIRIASDRKGKAYLTQGISKKHSPKLNVPTECILNRDLGTPDEVKHYGLRTIAIPGGEYLTEIDLQGAKMDLINSVEESLAGAIRFSGTDKDSRDLARDNSGSYDPNANEWKRLAYSVDLGEMTTKPLAALENVADGTITLPAGSLEALIPPSERRRQARWTLTDELAKPVGTQRLTDRLLLVSDAITGDVSVTFRKAGAPVLDFKIRPMPGESVVRLCASSHCCLVPVSAGTSTAELGEYGNFLVDGKLGATLEPYGPAVTDVHALCPSMFSIE